MAETPERALRQPHVLLAEDDEGTAHAIRTLLQQCGYRVTVARTSQEALGVFRASEGQRFDLVLTDYLTPKVNGLEVAAEVTKCKEGPGVPVIVTSAQASQDLICKAFQSGAAHYLQKPIRHNEVVTLWRHLWRGAQRPQSTQSTRVDFSPKDCLTMDTSRQDGKATCGGSSQEDGSGCEMQSSCTVTAPATKRTKKAHSPDTPALMSAGSHESSALNFMTRQLDVVEDSKRQPPTGNMADTETADCTVGRSQVLPGRPHEAPVFSGVPPRSHASILSRVLSCPSMLAAQARQHTGVNHKKRFFECVSSSEDATPNSLAATEDDSGNSAATAEDAACAAMDTSPFAAFCKLSGCEGRAVTNPVHLEIAPLDLTPWPSTTSSVGRQGSLGRQASLATQLPSYTREQAQAAAASLCDLAKVFAAAVPWTGPRAAPPLLQPLKVASSLELSLERSCTPKETAAAEGCSSSTGPKQQVAPGKSPKCAADPYSLAVQGDPAIWAANRRAALERLRKKKKLRSFRKKVRYESRRLLAESRPRVRGQFVKAGMEVA